MSLCLTILLTILVGNYPYSYFCDVDNQGNLFFTSNSGYIYKYPYNNQTNPAIKLIGSGGSTILEGNGLNASIPYASGITINPVNNNIMLITSITKNQLLQINLTNQINSVQIIPTTMLHVYRLTYDNNATYVYVTTNIYNTIYRVRVSDWYAVRYAGTVGGGRIDGVLSSSKFSSPRSIICDNENNLYIGEFANGMVRIISPNQLVSTLAGSGNSSLIPTVGLGNFANIHQVTDVAISQNGSKFYVLLYSSYVRELSCSVGYNFSYGSCLPIPTFNSTYSPTTSELTVNYVSNIVINSFLGTGIAGTTDGAASVVKFNHPIGMCMDYTGEHLYTLSNTAGTVRKTNTSDGWTMKLGNNFHLFSILFD